MKKLTKIIIIGAIILIVGLAGAVIWLLNRPTNTASSDTTTSTATSSVFDDAEILSIGQTIVFGKQEFTLNSVKASNTIPAGNNTLTASAGSIYVIANVTSKNTTAYPFDFSPYDLYSQSGKGYNADSDASFYIEEDMVNRRLQPDVPETGNIVYKIPSDTTTVYIGGTNVSSGKIFLFKSELHKP